MENLTCVSDCDQLNTSTCQYLESVTIYPKSTNSAIYDDAGCFDVNEYITFEMKERHRQFSKILSVLMMSMGSLGFLGNILAIFVLSRPDMTNCFSQILVSMIGFDSLHIVSSILEAVRLHFEEDYPQIMFKTFPFLQYPMQRMTMVASIFLLIGTGIERYLAVCRPHHFHSVQDQKLRSLNYIIPSILAAILINIPRVSLRPTKMRTSWNYTVYFHTWTWNIFTGVLPLICLIILNLRIYVAMRKLKLSLAGKANGKGVPRGLEATKKRMHQQKKDMSMAVILISTIVMFILFHSPRVMVSIYEAGTIKSLLFCRSREKEYRGIWYLYIQQIIQLMMVVNCAINLPVYLAVSPPFRASFKKYMSIVQNMFICRSNSGESEARSPPSPESIPLQQIQTPPTEKCTPQLNGDRGDNGTLNGSGTISTIMNTEQSC